MQLQRQVIDFGEPCLSTNERVAQQIEENISDEIIYDFSLFPNPNNGNFSVENLSSREFTGIVEITDVLGKTVLVKDWLNTTNLSLNLSSTTKPGLYFIKIKNGNGENIYTSKFIFN